MHALFYVENKHSQGTSLAVPGGSAKDLHGSDSSSADMSDPHKVSQFIILIVCLI